MNFLKKIAETATTATETGPVKAEGSGGEKLTTENAPASQSELLSSAKMVADAAQSAFKHEPTKYDNAELAGASADILDAAGRYGKLENTAVGGYVEQAEEYLHKYETSNSKAPPAANTSEEPDATTDAPEKPTEEAAKTVADKSETAAPAKTEEPAEQAKVEPPAAGEAKPQSEEPEEAAEEKSEGGIGDYAKLAQGFSEKNKISDDKEGDGGAKSEGGIGDYVKTAEGFLNKKSGDSESTGYGDALKFAGDFLKKN